jgi:hypothetical protein
MSVLGRLVCPMCRAFIGRGNPWIVGIFFQLLLMALFGTVLWTDEYDVASDHAILLGLAMSIFIWWQVFTMIKANREHSREIERRRTTFVERPK